MDQSDIDVVLLEGAKATTKRVKTEMKAHNWVHFACHGIQDVAEPLESGVHLHDGRLELLEIMRQQILNPDFAFLSACQTSKGDLKLSEEVVHLAAGMLAAGYRGVVGTMWSISDMHGPEFATEFYKYLLTKKGPEGLDSTQAAYALDYAVRKVRKSLGDSDTAFLTWVPYVHFGYWYLFCFIIVVNLLHLHYLLQVVWLFHELHVMNAKFSFLQTIFLIHT